MTSINLSDVAGDYTTSAEDFKTFVRNWYLPNDLVVMWEKREDQKSSSSDTYYARDLLATTDEAMQVLVRDSEGYMYDDYFNACPVKAIVDTKGRANNNDAVRMPGVWIDLDVKAESFSSKEQILEFLGTLPLEPSIINDSGNGYHVYWRFIETDVEPDHELSVAWQAYVRGKMNGLECDHTADLARVLRCPGSVHTGKGSGVYSPVRLHKVTGRAYPVQVVRGLAKEALERLRADRAVKRNKESILTGRMVQLTEAGPFTQLIAKAGHEDIINERFDWADILECQGWELNRTLGDGSREWTRPGPGASKRSATTDHEGSNVMALHSGAEETGLSDLKDVVYLTKTRVMLRIWFDDKPEKLFAYLCDELLRHSEQT